MDFLVAHGDSLLFYLFGAVAVVGALLVVALRNPMYGAIALLSSFLAVAALFLLRHAEFVGIVQIFVYGGGIMVLFLFVIMLVNLHRLPEIKLFGGQSPLAFVLAVLLLAFFGWFFLQMRFGPALRQPQNFVIANGQTVGNSQAVAWGLYMQQLLPFEIASVFLLIAMIGAVVMGRRQ